MKKIALCLYGINRSLSVTAESILKNVVTPWSNAYEVHLYGAFLEPQDGIRNVRSGEIGVRTETSSFALLPFDKVSVTSQEALDQAVPFESVLPLIQDYYKDEHQSSKNIFRSLYALQQSYRLAAQSEQSFDVIAFIRPDLFYIDTWDVDRITADLQASGPSGVITPRWQQWGGLNDRIAVCTATSAAIFQRRFECIFDFIAQSNEALHAESMLLWFCIQNGLCYDHFMRERGIRVRANGTFREEQFSETGINRASEEKYRLLK